jgi:hypothetical protein
MKVKEYFPSLKTALSLKCIPLDILKAKAAPSLPIIVTLTSIPSRLHKIDLTIRSLLNQSTKPEKIVLWLNQSLEKVIPKKLTSLEGDIFEIRYSDLYCSHRKLIHSLIDFPERVLVTCDDDQMYNPDFIKSLYIEHSHFPNDIVSNECREVSQDSSGKLLPYKEWKYSKELGISKTEFIPLGYSGVLYPPNALNVEATNIELFLALAPKADDLWFKMMSLLNKTKVRRPAVQPSKPILIIGSQKISLKKTNITDDGNRVQWVALCDHYSSRLRSLNIELNEIID